MMTGPQAPIPGNGSPETERFVIILKIGISGMSNVGMTSRNRWLAVLTY